MAVHLQTSRLSGLLVLPGRVNDVEASLCYRGIVSASRHCEVDLALARKLLEPAKTPGTLIAEVSRADLILADISTEDPVVYFYIGMAHAFKKLLVTLSAVPSHNIHVRRLSEEHITYENSDNGEVDLKANITSIFEAVKEAKDIGVTFARDAPAEMDWELVPREDYGNLCLEILLHKGFTRVEWVKNTNMISMTALKHRHIDGRLATPELSIVSTGGEINDTLTENLWLKDIKILSHKLRLLMEECRTYENDQTEDRTRCLNVIFIWSPGCDFDLAIDESHLRRVCVALQEVFSGNGIRMRLHRWDQKHVEAFVRERPVIRYRYFGKGGKLSSKRQMTVEDVYRDAIDFSRSLSKTIKELQEEGPAHQWQSLAFTATHSIGNAIFPIETYTEELIAMLDSGDLTEARYVLMKAKDNIKLAKSHILRFQSVTSEIKPKFERFLLKPQLESVLEFVRRREIRVTIYCDHNLELYADVELFRDLFTELAINSVTWLHGIQERHIEVAADLADESDLPNGFLERNIKFARIVFGDNGPGVEVQNKKKIFDLFFSEYPQGKGIGLAIAKRIVNALGGHIYETGLPGSGARFVILLPCLTEKILNWKH